MFLIPFMESPILEGQNYSNSDLCQQNIYQKLCRILLLMWWMKDGLVFKMLVQSEGVLFLGKMFAGYSVTNNVIRIIPYEDIDGGYLFAFLNSPYGVTLISRNRYGSVQDHIDAHQVRKILVPWPEENERNKIGELVIQADKLRYEANCLEDDAQALLMQALGLENQ